MESNKDLYFSKKKDSDLDSIFIEKKSYENINFIHKILDTINISLLIFVFILSFLSFDSQEKWSNTFRNLSILKSQNNNLLDYISKTENFYINEIESLSSFKKTTPKDLIYLDKITYREEDFFKKKQSSLVNGLKDSKYQIGY